METQQQEPTPVAPSPAEAPPTPPPDAMAAAMQTQLIQGLAKNRILSRGYTLLRAATPPQEAPRLILEVRPRESADT